MKYSGVPQPKALYLRPVTGFGILLSLNKYLLTCRVTSRYVLYETDKEPFLLSQIPIYSGIFMFYSDKFSHIVAYLEHEIYSELCQGIFWHTQNTV